MELFKLLSASEIFAQIINFLILFFILRIFLWKRVLSMLDNRKNRIAEEFKKLGDAQAEAAKLKSDFAAKLSSIEDIAKEKVEAGVAEGAKQAEKIKKNAQLEAEKIIESARKDVKFEISKAKEELKDQIIDLTIKATQSLISEKFTEADDKKLVEGFLEQIDKLEHEK